MAIADPSDLNTIDSLTHLLNAEIELRVASEQDIEAALNKYYGGANKATTDVRSRTYPGTDPKRSGNSDRRA